MNHIESTFKVNASKVVLSVVFLILFTITLFQIFGASVDYKTYLDFIAGVSIANPPKEPFAFILRELTAGNSLLFFAVFACIGIATKLWAISGLSKYIYLSLFAYFFSYFFLHDYTQIRVGVSSGIFLLSIKDIRDRNLGSFLFKSTLAIAFHFSALIMLPLYFIVGLKKSIFRILPILGIIIVFINVNLQFIILKLLSLNQFINDLYMSKRGHTESIKILNLISISYFLLFYCISLIEHKLDKTDLVLFKILSISLFIFFGFSVLEMPVITYRIYEFLNIVLIVLLANIVSYFKQKLLLTIGICIYFVLHLLHLLFNVNIIA